VKNDIIPHSLRKTVLFSFVCEKRHYSPEFAKNGIIHQNLQKTVLVSIICEKQHYSPEFVKNLHIV